jgi:hypothetical protein
VPQRVPLLDIDAGRAQSDLVVIPVIGLRIALVVLTILIVWAGSDIRLDILIVVIILVDGLSQLGLNVRPNTGLIERGCRTSREKAS